MFLSDLDFSLVSLISLFLKESICSGKIIRDLLYGAHFSWPTTHEFIIEVVVAVLQSGSLTYSGIIQQIVDKCSSAKEFDSCLSEVSDLSIPNSFDDGKYQLKTSFRSYFSPYFWAYAPETRERAIERCCYRFEDVSLSALSETSRLSLCELKLLKLSQYSEVIIDVVESLLKSKNSADFGLGKCLFLLLESMCLPNVDNCRNTLMTVTSEIEEKSTCKISGIDNKLNPSFNAADAKKKALSFMMKSQSLASGFLPQDIQGNIPDCDKFPLTGPCVICQEQCDSTSSAFGALTYIGDIAVSISYAELDSNELRTIKSILASCFHLVHLNCFHTVAEDQLVSCPLCSASFNCCVPIVPLYIPKINVHLKTPAELSQWISSGHFSLLLERFSTECKFHINLDCVNSEKVRLLHGIGADPYMFLLNSLLYFSALELEGFGINSSQSKILRIISELFRIWGIFSLSSLSSSKQAAHHVQTEMTSEKHSGIFILLQLLLSSSFDHFLDDLNHIVSFYMLVDLLSASSSEEHKLMVQLFRNVLNLFCDSDVILNEYYELEQLRKFQNDMSLFPPHLKSIIELFNREMKPPFFRLHHLIRFPTRYDHLLKHYSQRTCSSCNSKPYFPAVCLACGTIICSTSCSHKDGQGECTRHLQRYLLTLSRSLESYIYLAVDLNTDCFYCFTKIDFSF